jgi:hypothetical protein
VQYPGENRGNQSLRTHEEAARARSIDDNGL